MLTHCFGRETKQGRMFATKAKLKEQVRDEMSSMSTDSVKLGMDRQARAESKVDDFKSRKRSNNMRKKSSRLPLASNKNTGNRSNDNKCTRKMLASPCCTPPDQLDHRRPPTHPRRAT